MFFKWRTTYSKYCCLFSKIMMNWELLLGNIQLFLIFVMHDFCRDSLWNSSISWHTNDPDFTECFQQNLLSYIPLCVFLILVPLELWVTKKKKNPRIGWSLLNIGKIFIIFSLIINSSVRVCILMNSFPLYEVEVESLATLAGALSYLLSALHLIISLRLAILGTFEDF